MRIPSPPASLTASPASLNGVTTGRILEKSSDPGAPRSGTSRAVGSSGLLGILGYVEDVGPVTSPDRAQVAQSGLLALLDRVCKLGLDLIGRNQIPRTSSA